jgi:hypothetical protein
MIKLKARLLLTYIKAQHRLKAAERMHNNALSLLYLGVTVLRSRLV